MRGDRLRELRKERKLSQDKLGELAGISREQVNRYENGKAVPDFATIIKIADALETSIDYLVGRTDEKPEIFIAPATFTEVMKNQREYVPKFDSEPKEEKPPFTKAQLDYLDRHLEEVVSRIREKEGFK